MKHGKAPKPKTYYIFISWFAII